FSFVLDPGVGIESVVRRLNGVLEGLDLKWRYKAEISMGVGFAKGNVWSRKARRQFQREMAEGRPGYTGNSGDKDDEDEEDEPALGFKIQLLFGKESNGVEVKVRWLQGRDSVLFESFCGMLKAKMS
ncbi:MAG: hypothetical protein Q9201_007998, partial [Fulgogasparrea decipioides]